MDSSLLRAFAYIVVGTLCLLAWRRERPEGDNPAIWTTFWAITAVVMLGLGLSRLLAIDDIVTGTGREAAHQGGWYEARRGLQAMVVAGLGIAWVTATGLAVLRIPERRRRYLPAAIVVLTIVCFAAIRAVSLHHLDQVLYNTELAGMRPVVPVEFSLLFALAVACVLALRSSIPAGLAARAP